MHHFYRKGRELYVEGVSVEKLAKKYGTPLYVYSTQTVLDHYHRFDKAFASIDHQIHYAVKTNFNRQIIQLLAKAGSCFDLVSGGEIYQVQKAGVAGNRCVFAGVGKTTEEIEMALKAGIYAFTVESESELRQISKIAVRMKKIAPVAVRVNPGVGAGGHAKITTGKSENKFGIAYEEVEALYRRAFDMPGLWLRGVHIHIGSGIESTAPFAAAVKKMRPLVQKLKDEYDIEFFDIGGGVATVYHHSLDSGRSKWWKRGRTPITAESYAQAVLPYIKDLGLKILFEPGKFLTNTAGALVTQVVVVKKTKKKKFVIVDAGMNDLLRPTLYEAYHEIVPVTLTKSREKVEKVDVVGPLCETGDYLAKDRKMPQVAEGDFVAAMSAGGHGFAMASNYNSRPRAAEVVVYGRKAKLARRRETYADLVRFER